MELKTLEDLIIAQGRRTSSTSIAFFINDLRQEAIKWVKDCSGGMDWNKRFDRKYGHCDGCSWFIKFFNLTEEDLVE